MGFELIIPYVQLTSSPTTVATVHKSDSLKLVIKFFFFNFLKKNVPPADTALVL